MSAAENAMPLEKPLAELTEEDIAQLTREDCRRYLKAKGMRRPSWNKSQAIQQVISLKALLEGRPGCNDCPAGGEIVRKYVPPRTPPLQASSPQDSLSPREVGRLLSPSKEPSPYRRRDQIPALQQSAGSPTSRTSTAVVDHVDTTFPENRFLSSRTTAELPAAGQMPIFYDGLVNVYDGVACDQRSPPASQAKAVLDLAASTSCFDAFPSPGVAPRFPGPLSTAATGRAGHHAADGAVDARAPRETEPDCGTSRKASLKRYLEKRKDRFKGKKIIGGPSYSCTEKIYLGENFRCPNPIDFTDLNMTSLPSTVQHQPPQSPASCPENQVQKDKFLIDLNVDGDEDC
ncbi:protein TIFY 4B-like [Curcuma longa]|uniref:protein TIFY 4B-like n=1 Tax=Curcuma longa TaxID=136217 RepID=UPI003D9F18CB